MSFAVVDFSVALQVEVAPWRQALDSNDYLGAWMLALDKEESSERWRAMTEILYRAGDPSGALEAARKGILENPIDAQLLHRALGASIWLDQGSEALDYAKALKYALLKESNGENVALRTSTQDLLAEVALMKTHHADLERCLLRARFLSASVLLVVVLVASWLLIRGYGKSSKPVS